MTYNRWDVARPDMAVVSRLEQAGYHPLAARLLERRGIHSAEAAEAFLTLKPEGLHDPFLLPDMKIAVDRLLLASEFREKVAVYGDYDADGVTATAVVIRALQDLAIKCVHHIPDRERDGYGLNEEALQTLRRRGIRLIVTVDTGCTAHREVEMAKQLGMDVIITDHHECHATLPDALAVINPRRPDSTYPFNGLAGVGVAFKLACALYGGWRVPLIRCAGTVALGTIADLMPVTGENRILITQGLKAMTAKPSLGIQALLHEADYGKKPVTSDTVAFIIAPRINAAGRVGRADTALELLLTDRPARARELSRTLCEMNTLRQSRENDIIESAKNMVNLDEPALVLSGDNWPAGVAGIVAARLSDQFERPVFVACLDGDMARGSARATTGIHLVELLGKLAHLLDGYGGHGQAAGFTAPRENMDALKAAILEECASLSFGETVLDVDAEIDSEWVDLDGLHALEALAPFGPGFPQPVFTVRGVTVTSIIPLGGGRHMRLVFDHCGRRLDAVWFHKNRLPASPLLDIAFRPEINHFRGQELLQLKIIDIKESGGDV
ncbi:MAG: single-stranded-DNA-specific exonuclease RecJ [Oscillospiraceae bacterium]|nr:single-stranded-DNA-specific exonuclease RecJ [Oscillospiraceae bacterium]